MTGETSPGFFGEFLFTKRGQETGGGPAGTYEVVVPVLVKTTATLAQEEEGALP